MMNLIPVERIEKHILLIKGKKVMLDAHLAELYDVETRILIQSVKRNLKRFPSDFMFQLNNQEVRILRSQFVILRKGHGQHRKYLPYVFTEQGVAMLSSVLRSDRAIETNVEIMRTFVRLREIILSHNDLAQKIAHLEKKCDVKFTKDFDEIFRLMEEPKSKSKRKIGFKVCEEEDTCPST